MDGPESIVEAEEYLQPKVKVGTTTTNSVISSGMDTQTSSLKPCTSSSWANNLSSPDCATSEGSLPPEGWDRDLLRKGVESEHMTEPKHYYTNCVLAVEVNAAKRPDISSDSSFDTMSKVKEAQVGDLKLNLPLDEDDYLVPSPQHTQNASAYMDLISEGTDPQVKDVIKHYAGFVGLSVKRCVDNPEYLMSDEGVPAQTLGIPSSTPTPPAPLPPRSPEEESMSDHEYYNDLQREMQPLRHSETTV